MRTYLRRFKMDYYDLITQLESMSYLFDFQSALKEVIGRRIQNMGYVSLNELMYNPNSEGVKLARLYMAICDLS
jgi:hypothetical protein